VKTRALPVFISIQVAKIFNQTTKSKPCDSTLTKASVNAATRA
jgi:hypothetical protein